VRIIGINSFWEEGWWKCKGGSASLIDDGRLVMSVAEDRISREKYEGGYRNALNYILDYHNLSMESIDYFCISFYGNHLVPDSDIMKYHLKDLMLESTPEKLVLVPSHHLSHAFSGYFLSPFDEAIIVVADNEGSILYSADCNNEGANGAYCERNSYYHAKGNIISLLERDFESPSAVGFGKAYNKFTEYIGFGDYHNAGKTMGLSSYGKIPHELESADLWSMDSKYRLDSYMTESYDNKSDVDSFLSRNGISINEAVDCSTEAGKNLARYIQTQLNKWAVEKIRTLIARTGVKNICISGGVAQNGVMNAHIERELGCRVFAPPFPSDQGQSLGNAIYAWVMLNRLSINSLLKKCKFENFVYLGSEFTDEQISLNIEQAAIPSGYSVAKSENIAREAAELIENNKIIGWFQGKSEYGCRALGNRSILANPGSAETRDRVNALKKRELFRPLAPTVLAEHAGDFFYAADSLLSEYMLGVVKARVGRQEKIAGAVHIDGTSRIQSLKRGQNPLYYELIEQFYNNTGIPMVLNTSFNIAGEPIVETPKDAIKTFLAMGLDALACGGYLIKKSVLKG
jgi:carbamoyltransferase